MTRKRIRFRDIKPYEVVDSLDDLQGPTHGEVTLPVTVYWSGIRSTFNIENWRDRIIVYSAALSNGRREDIIEFVDRDRLFEAWPYLALDDRVIDLWRGKFPEIAALDVGRRRAHSVSDPETGAETREW